MFLQIQQQMQKGVNPRVLLSDLGVDYDQIPDYVDDVTIWKIIINMLAEPPRRNKLRHVNTLDDVVRLLKGLYVVIIEGNHNFNIFVSSKAITFIDYFICRCSEYHSANGCWCVGLLRYPRLPIAGRHLLQVSHRLSKSSGSPSHVRHQLL